MKIKTQSGGKDYRCETEVPFLAPIVRRKQPFVKNYENFDVIRYCRLCCVYFEIYCSDQVCNCG